MKKVFFFIVLILVILNTLVVSVVISANNNVVVNGINLHIESINERGRILVPVRGVFEALGYTVDYDSSSKTAFLYGTKNIVIVNGRDYFTCDDKVIKPEVPQKIVNSKFYIPLRAVSEAIGANVSWDAKTKTAYITAPVADKDSDGINISEYEHQVMELINEKRIEKGLNPFVWDESLATVARGHSSDMATRNYLDNNTPEGTSLLDKIKEAGIYFSSAFANISAGQNTPKAVVDALLSSSEQRVEDIFNKDINYIGVGLYYDKNSQYGYYWTVCFKRDDSTMMDISKYEHEVLELVNIERTSAGLNILTWDDSLADVARNHSNDMAKRNYFEHNTPEGITPFDRIKNAGIDYTTAAENIAAGQTTPKDVVVSWMNSPGHRANILNGDLKYLGVGLVFDANSKYGFYWTQNFKK